MLTSLKKGKGQSTTEHIALVIIIIGALLAMQFYLKRSMQGRLKASADDLGEQFSPGNTNVVQRIVSDSTTRETLENGASRSQLQSAEIYQVSENKAIHDTYGEYWGR